MAPPENCKDKRLHRSHGDLQGSKTLSRGRLALPPRPPWPEPRNRVGDTGGLLGETSNLLAPRSYCFNSKTPHRGFA